jgi:hypothetical protein
LRPLFEGALLGAELAWAITSNSVFNQKKIVSCEESKSSRTHLFVKCGERENAMEYIQSWMNTSLSEYLRVCDPYFGPEDLEILNLILSIDPSCNVTILTSRKHQKDLELTYPLEECYRAYWRMKLSEQDPPPTEIVIVGLEQSGAAPIHDRWLLSKDTGLRLGTSLNSLGITKDSEISLLGKQEVASIDEKVNQYFDRTKKEHGGKKLLYTLFTL